MRYLLSVLLFVGANASGQTSQPKEVSAFLSEYCLDCHDADTKKGGLDLESLSFDLAAGPGFSSWVKVHDYLREGEMPPKKKSQPTGGERDAFLSRLSGALVASDRSRQETEGRVVFRRLNRTEYENTLRDLLGLPHLQVREMLPADGEAHGFDTVGEALNVSYVQIATYLEVADLALDQAIALTLPEDALNQPAKRHWNFDKIGRFNSRNGENQPLGETGRIILRQPNSAQTPLKIPPAVAEADGEYRLRLSAYGLYWENGEIKPADRPHVLSFYAELNKVTRLLETFEVPADQSGELEATAWMLAGERILVHANSLDDRNEPISTKKRGQPYRGPGIGLDWFEMEGPLRAEWPPRSHQLLFGDLPLQPWTADSGLREPVAGPAAARPNGKTSNKRPAPVMVVSPSPERDAERLLRGFMERAFRRPLIDSEFDRCFALVKQRLDQKYAFHEAMRTGFKAVLCSPDFLFFKEAPGRLDDYALASRLSYFLWKSMPDETLLTLAAKGELSAPAVLRAQTERLLNDPRAGRFVNDFLDQWLELRRIAFTQPDGQLYPEFSPWLQDSMVAESRAFFAAMLREDLGADHLVRSDFAFVNAPLAKLYEIPGVKGVDLRRVSLPEGSSRGGFLTQGSVLKVTANGTTTSPVTRGAWIMERLLGQPVPPPPPGAGSIEPDVRGTTTIREQLDKHRSIESCAGCHRKIDPPGFALESFDVMGGWRDRYRSLDLGQPANRIVRDKPVRYKLGLPVDASGQSVGGEPFGDIHDFRKLLLRDKEQLARNLAERLLVYATGAGVSFADRAAIERILAGSVGKNYGTRSLAHAVVQSDVFRRK